MTDLLTTDTIRNLFTEIKYSEQGTNDRVHEEEAFMFFIDYMDDCERGMTVTMEGLLQLHISFSC